MAGFNSSEARDKQGEWTSGAGSTEKKAPHFGGKGKVAHPVVKQSNMKPRPNAAMVGVGPHSSEKRHKSFGGPWHLNPNIPLGGPGPRTARQNRQNAKVMRDLGIPGY